MVTVLVDPAFECYEDLGDLVNPTNKGETMKYLWLSIILILVFIGVFFSTNEVAAAVYICTAVWLGFVSKDAW